MQILQQAQKHLLITLAALVLCVGGQAPAMADMISTEQLAAQAELDMKRDEIRTFLARDDVRDTLLGLGVDDDDAEQRVSNLTDSEVLQVHQQLADMPAGGNFLGAVLTIIVIFMLLDIAGATDVFPNI